MSERKLNANLMKLLCFCFKTDHVYSTVQLISKIKSQNKANVPKREKNHRINFFPASAIFFVCISISDIKGKSMELMRFNLRSTDVNGNSSFVFNINKMICRCTVCSDRKCMLIARSFVHSC